MKATGIVRRIDELGRVVIPKEIRRTLRIKNGDPLEIFTSETGGVVLKKYSALSELEDFASQYADSLAKTSGHMTFITDRDSVIAVSGGSKKEYYDKHISTDLERIMEERSTVVARNRNDGVVPVLDNEEKHNFTAQVITPIVANGDAIGTVVMLETDSRASFGEAETKLTQSAASILGKQFEQS